MESAITENRRAQRNGGRTGLAVGLLVALAESIWMLSTVPSAAEVGLYPLLGLLFWGLLGHVGGRVISRLRTVRRRRQGVAPVATRAGATVVPVILALCTASLVAITAFAVTRDEAISIDLYQPPGLTPVSAPHKSPKMLVLGLDAATWTILQPMLDAGELPALHALMERGTWGTLLSDRDSFSPVVWNTIMTGKPPALHGVHTLASERRVPTVWEIATAAGFPSAVINVPGTYPVRSGAQVMMAGFPVKARQNLSNLGWVISSSSTWREPAGPVFTSLDLDPAAASADPPQQTRITLRDLPVTTPLDHTVPFRLLSLLGHADARYGLQRLLGAVPFARFELEVERSADGELRLLGRKADQGNLFALRPGEWSDWLAVDSGRWRGYFKLRFVDSSDDLTLFATPIFAAPNDRFMTPAAELGELAPCPYVAEGAGWLLFRDPRLLDTLATHQMEVASCRFDTGLAVLDHYEPDLMIYVFTVTDRLQHAFMKYLYPDEYVHVAEVMGGDFEKLLALPEEVDRFEDVIPDTYRQVDLWMAELLARVDPSTPVLVVSDHGAMAGAHNTRPTAGVHNRKGIYVVSTAGAPPPAEGQESPQVDEVRPSSAPGPELVLEDSAATILYLLGLPVGEDMTGRVPQFLVAADRPVATVPSYDSAVLESDQEELEDAAVLEQIRSLGYIE